MNAKAAMLAALLLAPSGCTTYRILRYREPDARNVTMFPTRSVRKADVPFQFARLPALRLDLDTVTVRAPGGARMPFAKYIESHSVLAFVVIRNDTVLYEAYRGGYTADRLHISMSVSKSILSALVGIALNEGRIRHLDQPITDFLPELRSRPEFAGVTVRHLLGMRSGLRETPTGNGPWSDLRSDEARVYYTTDLRAFLAKARRDTLPGTLWKYKDTDAELLGWVLTAATGKSVAEYTEEKLWRRIGTAHDATWSLDRSGGQERVSSGFNVTALDLARFGRLYLDGGMWNGQRVLPAEWVARSAAVDTTRSEPEIPAWWQMQHTLYWWHAIQPPFGDYFADGSHGQRLYVDPASRTIIVQLANDSRQDFPFRKVVAHLNARAWEYPRSIPAILNQAAGVSADSVRPTFDRLMAERARQPERYVITESTMHAVGTLLLNAPQTRSAAVIVFAIMTELYPSSARAFVGLSNAHRMVGDTTAADVAKRRAPTP